MTIQHIYIYISKVQYSTEPEPTETRRSCNDGLFFCCVSTNRQSQSPCWNNKRLWLWLEIRGNHGGQWLCLRAQYCWGKHFRLVLFCFISYHIQIINVSLWLYLGIWIDDLSCLYWCNWGHELLKGLVNRVDICKNISCVNLNKVIWSTYITLGTSRHPDIQYRSHISNLIDLTKML